MNKERVLRDEEIIECTGARQAHADAGSKGYQVQRDGMWIDVDYDSYEKVRKLQDSCA